MSTEWKEEEQKEQAQAAADTAKAKR